MDKLLEYLFLLIEKIDWLLKPVKSTNDYEFDSYLNAGKNSVRFLIFSIFLIGLNLLISIKDDGNKYGVFINIVNPILSQIKFGLLIASSMALVGCLIYSARWLYLRWKLDIND